MAEASAGSGLRDRLAQEDVLLVPGCYDVLSARLFEQLGFEAIWAGGFMASASRLGLADVNLITVSELADFARACSMTTSVPVIVDVDNGFGNAINVMRTVRELESAGVAALVIEDQVTPKRCGLFPGERPIVGVEEMVGKIRAAVDSRIDDGLMIIARTDSFGAGLSIDEAIDRAAQYIDAGADAILPISKVWANLEGFGKSFRDSGYDVPLLSAPTLFGDVTYEQVGDLGYNAQIQPLAATAAALWGMKQAMQVWMTEGAPASYLDRSFSFEEITELIGLSAIAAAEDSYLPAGSSLVGA